MAKEQVSALNGTLYRSYTHIHTRRKNARKSTRDTNKSIRKSTQRQNGVMRHTAAYGLCNIHKVLVAAISFTQPKRQRKTPHKLIRMNNAKCDSSYSLVNAPSNIYQRTRATIYCLICLLFLIFWTTHSFIHKHLHRRFSPHIFHFMTFLVPLAFCFGFQQQSKKKTPKKSVFNAYLFGGVLSFACTSGFVAVEWYEFRLLTSWESSASIWQLFRSVV